MSERDRKQRSYDHGSQGIDPMLKKSILSQSPTGHRNRVGLNKIYMSNHVYYRPLWCSCTSTGRRHGRKSTFNCNKSSYLRFFWDPVLIPGLSKSSEGLHLCRVFFTFLRLSLITPCRNARFNIVRVTEIQQRIEARMRRMRAGVSVLLSSNRSSRLFTIVSKICFSQAWYSHTAPTILTTVTPLPRFHEQTEAVGWGYLIEGATPLFQKRHLYVELQVTHLSKKNIDQRQHDLRRIKILAALEASSRSTELFRMRPRTV